jgi:aspartate aminotransferase
MALDARARQLMRAGSDVAVFTLGEPDFDTPDNVKQATYRALQSGFTKYTEAAGMLELRQAIAGKLERENGVSYAPEEILVANGAKHVLYEMLLCLVEPGDQVILSAPYWVSYADQALMCGAEPVIVDVTDRRDMKLTPQRLQAAVTDRTRALILNSPCNPTGTVLTGDEVRELVAAALSLGLWIISDEIYEKFMYDGAEHLSPASLSPEARQHVITVNGFSKTYAMTGWRLGYAAGPADVIRAAARLQSNMTSGPNSFAQKGAIEALQGSQDSVEEMRQAFDQRRHVLVEGLNRLSGVSCPMPQGAFYAFPDCRPLLGKQYGGRRLTNSLQLSEALLEHARVAVVPGSAFGAEGYLRFSYAASVEVVRKGVERMASFVEALRD